MATVTPDAVKLEIGGVPREAKELLTDVAITRIIEEEVTLNGSAARCAEILSRLFASKADESIGDYRVTYADTAKRWMELAKKLRTKVAMPYFGAMTETQKQLERDDANATKPDFWRGMMENNEW